MANRNVPTSASASPVTGPSLLDTYAARFQALFDAMALVPTSVSNSGNDYTITIDPVLDADVQNGMCFYVTPSAANDGAARLRVTDSNPYYSWTKCDGSEYESGDLSTGVVYTVVFISGVFKTVSSGAGSGDTPSYTAYTESGYFAKPATFNDNAIVFVEMWGGGGGGSVYVGGGGGAYNSRFLRLADLAGVETVTVGAGGTSGVVGVAGGKSAFGTYLEAYGGGPGTSDTTTSGGGGGGGATSVGGNGTATVGGAGGGPGSTSTNGSGGGPGTGYYGGGGGDYNNGNGGSSTFGGGGGGGAQNGNGGDSLYGGAGGGGSGGSGGTSIFGGNGGDGGQAGSVPGGGAGAVSTAGGRGEVRVWIFQ